VIRPTKRHEAGWLLLDGPLPEGAKPLPGQDDVAETLLGSSSELPFGFKVAACGPLGLRLRAERPEPLSPDAAGSLVGRRVPEGHATTSTSETTPIDLAGLCREAGWAFEARSDGALVVDLGVGGAYLPALVEARTSIIAVEASIVSPLPEAPECRAALAAFLLRANAAFRMMRAVLRERGDECEAVLEAPLPSDANASDLSRALGAVAVAARHCAIEARMLADDERIARAYLNHWGGTLEPAP
jgi:hypothetical protein